jgi:hypothetical protein
VKIFLDKLLRRLISGPDAGKFSKAFRSRKKSFVTTQEGQTYVVMPWKDFEQSLEEKLNPSLYSQEADSCSEAETPSKPHLGKKPQ